MGWEILKKCGENEFWKMSKQFWDVREFYSIFEKVLLKFKENFSHFFGKFYLVFNKISYNFQKNFTQF